MGNIYDELKQDQNLAQGLFQVIDEYHIMKQQIRRIQAAIVRIDNSGLHNTADILRDALNGGLGNE